MMHRAFWSRTATSLIAVALFILFWEIGARVYNMAIFVPPPDLVARRGAQMISNGEMFSHIWASLKRILAGYLIGCAIGIPIGLLMGNFRVVRNALEPFTEFFRFIPSIAWLTPAVIWFGIGETSRILIIAYTTVFIVIINTAVGVSSININKRWAAQCVGATRFQEFMYVVCPATIPYILTGMRLAMGNSFATVVSAEMIAADEGIGFLIFNSRLYMATDTIFLAIIVLGAMGFLVDRLFRISIRRFSGQFGPVE